MKPTTEASRGVDWSSEMPGPLALNNRSIYLALNAYVCNLLQTTACQRSRIPSSLEAHEARLSIVERRVQLISPQRGSEAAYAKYRASIFWQQIELHVVKSKLEKAN